MIPNSLTPNDYPAWIAHEARLQTEEIRQEMESRFGEGTPVAAKEPILADPLCEWCWEHAQGGRVLCRRCDVRLNEMFWP
jgi:hypothetical protein